MITNTVGYPTKSIRGAQRIAYRGKPIFPCREDKSPLTPRGFRDATTNPGLVKGFWTKYPDALIGMPTGSQSGVFVVDVDRLEALGELERELPETLTARTRSGGLHIYFKHVEGVRNSPGGLPKGIDVRGSGGYVIVPPSPGYSWIDVNTPIAEAPKWLVELLRTKHFPPKPRGLSADRPKVDLDDAGPIQEGTRNMTLTSLAGFLHDGTRDLVDLTGDLLAVNDARCTPPLEADEVRGIAESIYRLEPCKKGRQRSYTPPKPEVVRLVGDILADWWRADWRGTGGKSDRDILLAYIMFALEAGTILPNGGILVDISHHQVAARARKSSSTAHTAHRRLKVSGWCRGGGNGPDRRQDRPEGVVLLPRPKQRKPEHPQPFREPLGGVFGFASLPTARRGRHSAPGLVRVASAGRIAAIDHMERIGEWSTERAIADALGLARVYDLRKRYLEPLEERGIVERSGKLWRLVEDWQDALERVFAEEEELERSLYSGLTSDERQKERREESRERWRNRDNIRPEKAPTSDEIRERCDSYPERRRRAIEDALAQLFREHPEYRGRRAGQVACRLVFYLPGDFPRGPDGAPKDAEVEALLDGVAA